MVNKLNDFSRSPAFEYSPQASKILGRDYWVVLDDFSFITALNGQPVCVFIPAGYLTDGASVPVGLRGIIPPWGVYGAAVVVHDYLCEYLTVLRNDTPLAITRKQCDEIFKVAMIAINVPKFQVNLIYGGVSLYRKLGRVHKRSYNETKASLEDALRERRNKYGRFSE